MQPELADDHPEIDQLALELVDLGIGPAPRCLAGESLDARDKHAPLP
jgi:hypothetical protein